MLSQERESTLGEFRKMPIVGIEIGLALGKWTNDTQELARLVLNERKAACGIQKSNKIITAVPANSLKKRILTMLVCLLAIGISLFVWICILKA
ncbi:MAG: hypothetical protein NG737_03060 [Omnitrophica bacterium]|nr:hypothetical protein [Candidatus Omnitrophota bacterium]